MTMRKLFPILFLLAAGCANMTEQQKQQAWITVGAAIVVGAIVAAQDDSQDSQRCHSFIVVGPGDSDHVTVCE